jgi:predicted amidohydrolase YtcJ
LNFTSYLPVLQLLLLPGGDEGPPAGADLIVRSAQVITLDRANRIAQAVAIRGDRILAVGTDDEVRPLVGPGTKIIDAGGKTRSTNSWDPWLGIWVAVTRQTEGAGVFNPDQRLSRIEALRFSTLGSARLHFEERDKGSIEPGKLADLILVDRDPLTCPDDRLAGTRVLWTMVAGRLVFRTP